MGDEGDLFSWTFDMPDGQLTFDSMNTPVRQELCRTSMNSSDEIAHGFATLETMPAIGSFALQFFAVGLDGHLRRRAMPCRLANLL